MNKKVISVLLLVILSVGLKMQVFADDICYQLNNTKMTVNGTLRNIDNEGTMPIIVSGHSLVPLRSVVENLGGTASWNPSTKEITISNGRTERMTMQIGSPNASVIYEDMNYTARMETAPIIFNGKTMIPVSELGGIKFLSYWDSKDKLIYVYNTEYPGKIISPGGKRTPWVTQTEAYNSIISQKKAKSTHTPGGYFIGSYGLIDIDEDGTDELVTHEAYGETDHSWYEVYSYKNNSIDYLGTVANVFCLSEKGNCLSGYVMGEGSADLVNMVDGFFKVKQSDYYVVNNRTYLNGMEIGEDERLQNYGWYGVEELGNWTRISY